MDVFFTSMGYTAHSRTNINRGFFGIENACSLPIAKRCLKFVERLCGSDLTASVRFWRTLQCTAQLECVAIRNLIAQDAVPVGGIILYVFGPSRLLFMCVYFPFLPPPLRLCFTRRLPVCLSANNFA